MPYIKPEERARFDCGIEELVTELVIDKYNEETDRWVRELAPGNLNYVVSSIMAGVIKELGLSYTLVNNMIGALECAKTELYRRVLITYEAKKINENGDVY